MYNVTREMLTQIIDGYIELSKKLKGDLVILNRVNDEDDEIIIRNLKDFNLIKTKSGDLIEVTIYVDDEDEVYEEFIIGKGTDYDKVQKNILSTLPKTKNSYNIQAKEIKAQDNPKKEKQNRDKGSNHFQKFMKK